MNQPPQGWGQQQGQQGYPPPQAPPKKKGMSAGAVVLIIFGALMVLGMGTCLVCVGAATTATKVAPSTTGAASDQLSLSEAVAHATVACEKLVTAGVARNCHQMNANCHCLNSTSTTCCTDGKVGFEVVGGFPNDNGMISCFRTSADYSKDGESTIQAAKTTEAADDYANLPVGSAKTRLLMQVGTTDTNPDKWDECMEKKKSVAACTKLYPKQYAAFHALYDAATRVVNEEVAGQALAQATADMRVQQDKDELVTSRFIDQCKDGVRSKLAFPDTADFHFVGIALQVVVLGEGARSWRSDVTAKNAFGMEVKHNFKCVLDPKKGLEVTVD
jgi:hypothetical protein